MIYKAFRFIFLATLASLALACMDEERLNHDGIGRFDGASKILNTPDNCEEGELLLCLDKGTAGQADAVLAGLSEEIDVTGFKPVFKIAPGKEEIAAKHGLNRWYRVTFDGEDLTSAARKASEFGQIDKIQFNKRMSLGSEARTTAWRSSGEAGGSWPFDDPMLSDQWNFINTGSRLVATDAREGADIAVKDAWTLTGGDSRIVVAVIDGPVKHDHPDLEANMWVNEAERDGEKGVDDDGNGYIDDVYGWNCEKDNGDINWKEKGESGHGTHVAGIVGAVNNNGIGVSSVAGGTGKGDGVRLMSCQIFQGGVSTNSSAAAIGFVYAADNGASIAQCSFGYENTSYESDADYIEAYPIEYYAIQYFLDKNNNNSDILDGNIAIFACGNDSRGCSSYPAAMAELISVTAFGPDFYPAYYTNYGPGCNISAPGGDVWLNYETSRSEILSTLVRESNGEDYGYSGGTSMACPHVTGVAALGIAYSYKLGKTFSRDEFTSMLLTSVNDMDHMLSGGSKFMGYDSSGSEIDRKPYTDYQYNMGTGAVDAWKFLMNLEGTPNLMVATGEKQSYDLSVYFGDSAKNLTYKRVTYDNATRNSLGLSSSNRAEIQNGRLVIMPTKVGSGKITVTAIAGGDTLGGEAQTGGMEISREISIVSRGVASRNGGWL